MNTKEIINFCVEKGMLIDQDLLSMFEGAGDTKSVKLILEKIHEHTQQKIITRNVFKDNKEKISQVFSALPNENQKRLEKLKINLGLSIEISKETYPEEKKFTKSLDSIKGGNIKILSPGPPESKKIEVKDFSRCFSKRYALIKEVLQENPRLPNLVSIDKLSNSNQEFSIIGMIYDRRATKNGNMMLEIEDTTGRIKAVITQKNKELFDMANNITLDSVVGFKGSGNREIIFVDDFVFPDAFLQERKKAPKEEWALFVSDIHVGSKNFMEKEFLEFVDYLNGNVPNTPEVENIKYLFVVGDLVAGVGVYPGQERELEIKDIEGQYIKFAEILSKIRSDIQIIIIPGNHDCVRLMEPQPILDEKYAWSLYNMDNVILAPNPSLVNIGATENFEGFNVLLYHGFSYFYYAHNIPCLIEGDASNSPDKIMHYLLKNRHIAPTHSSNQYFPTDDDSLLMRTVPDIFVSGHTHKNKISYYNNILTISNACWEELMPYQEKMGFESDYCKVPMFNLKTRETKILDFHEEEK